MIKIRLIFLCLLPLFAAAQEQPYSAVQELFPGGSFDAGIQNLEIYRYPQFSVSADTVPPAIHGRGTKAVLRLPSLPIGGYKLTSSVALMKAGAPGEFSVDVVATTKTAARIEVVQGSTRIAQESIKLDAGIHHLSREFLTNLQGNDSLVPVRIIFWLHSTQEVNIDNFSIRGAGEPVPREISTLVPDLATGVYGIDETGHMRLQGHLSDSTHYQIRDVISGTVEQAGTLGADGRLPLFTARRGAFRVSLVSSKESGHLNGTAQRMYVVINRLGNAPLTHTRFGIAMEEHGDRAMVEAQIQPNDLYRLAAEIGAGSVRLFTPGSPDMVSRDGVSYNFNFIDKVLDACELYGLEPLLELGSNLPQRIPGWLKVKSNSPDAIDLNRGLPGRKLRKKLEQAGGGTYLDLEQYRHYLQQLFAHVADRVNYYEVWNEPGHKFTAQDYARILLMTRQLQQEFDPDAKLIGFSSTKGRGSQGSGSNRPIPGFLARLVELGALKDIDILSYHSEHAFKYLGDGFDERNNETGYVPMLRKALGDLDQMPIWDTERGVAWVSPDKNRVDQDNGLRNRHPDIDPVEYFEVARRLPTIYAASQAAGVERLFWFFMVSSTSTRAKARNRFGFFDAQLEPMPHLAVYDAMTEMLENAEFGRLIEEPSGLRAYLFRNEGGTIALLFNWKEKHHTVSIAGAPKGFGVFDVMGNRIKEGVENGDLEVDGWPRYLQIDGVSPEKVSIQ